MIFKDKPKSLTVPQDPTQSDLLVAASPTTISFQPHCFWVVHTPASAFAGFVQLSSGQIETPSAPYLLSALLFSMVPITPYYYTIYFT